MGHEMIDISGEREFRERVRELVHASGSSFFWGMRLLPARKRDAMFAVYAFCREVDDIADDVTCPQSEKLARLGGWREEIDRLFTGRPQEPTARALLRPVREFDLQRRDFLAVIDGMEMDAREIMRAPSMAELELYCSRVAGAVGLLSTRIFGDASKRACDHAMALGHALQLTNILRDIHEDAACGRLYLPREMLQSHGIVETDPDRVLSHPAFPRVCAELAEHARKRFDEAVAALADCDRRALRPASIMRVVYSGILERLLRRGWNRLDQPVRVSKPEKLWIALRHGIL